MDPSVREKYLQAGRIAGRGREYGRTLVVEGAKLVDVATQVEAFVRKEGGAPAFPCCLSVNADAAHYTPAVGDTRVFAKGDLVKLDVGVQVDGYIGDTATTIEVGTSRHQALIDASAKALEAALAIAKADLEVRDIGGVVEKTIQSFGFTPIQNLTGHSVDRFHQHAGLSIPNVPRGGGKLPLGGAVAIEPFATDGAGKVRDGGGGHIWHFVAPRPQRDPLARKVLEWLQKNHPDLPFAERWVADAVPAEKVAYTLKVLERSGAVRQYPILHEARDGMVAQTEHTVLVEKDGVTITTLA